MSSKEVIGSGPLDRHENAVSQVIEIEHAAQSDPVKRTVYQDRINELDHLTPYIDQKVVITGLPLARVMDEDGAINLTLFDEGVHTQLEGTYQGFDLIYVNNGDYDERILKAVHLLHTDTTGESLPSGDLTVTYHRTLFCVDKSDVLPVEPINAHRHEDILNDALIQSLSKEIFSKTVDRAKKLRTISTQFNKELDRDPFNDGQDFQRLSYLHAQDLLTGISIATKKAYIIMGQTENSTEIAFTLGSEIIAFDPTGFGIGKAYEQPKPEEVKFSHQKELYIVGKTDDDKVIKAPLKDIVGIQWNQ